MRSEAALLTSLLPLLLLVVAVPASHGSLICPELQAAIDAAGPEELIACYFLLPRFDLSTLDLEGFTREQRRRIIIAALQNHARVTQEEILKRMHNPAPGEIIKNIQSTWLANAVDCKANASAILALAARSEVELACINLPAEVPEPVEPATWGRIKAAFND